MLDHQSRVPLQKRTKSGAVHFWYTRGTLLRVSSVAAAPARVGHGSLSASASLEPVAHGLTTSHGFLCNIVPKVERITRVTLLRVSSVAAAPARVGHGSLSASASLEPVARGRRARRRAASDHRKRNDGGKSGHLHFEWPLGLVSVHRAPERERQSSLPSYHAARRALRGLEKNTTPSDPQWCGSFTEWPLGEWPPSGHSV